MQGAETCVCCGAIIPEGRQICPTCELAGDYAFFAAVDAMLKEEREKEEKERVAKND